MQVVNCLTDPSRGQCRAAGPKAVLLADLAHPVSGDAPGALHRRSYIINGDNSMDLTKPVYYDKKVRRRVAWGGS